jgi:uncharacterized protein involved in type VI secretion and phage assembly
MSIRLFESETQDDQGGSSSAGGGGAASSIVTGTVVSNFDSLNEGKVLVRIPSIDAEVWARLCAPGAGSGAGLFYVPRSDDEVLVAITQGNPEDAFVLGGLWNSSDGPPVDSGAEAVYKRVLETGVEKGTGHRVEFDDVEQSITIVTPTKQKVTIDTTTIELANSAGNLKVTLDNTSQTVTIKGINVEIEATASLKLKGGQVSLESSVGECAVKSATECSVKGTLVRIN